MEQLSGGPSARRSARGVTTIELLVSIAISLLILSALTYIYVGSRGAYRTNEGVARVQEAGRFAIDWLSRDLRMASHLGPGTRSLPSEDIQMLARPPILALDNVSLFTGRDQTVTGYENGTGWIIVPVPTIARVRGDVLRVRSAVGQAVEIATATDVANSRNCVLANSLKLQKNETVMLASFDRMAVFRVTNDPAPSTCTTFAGAQWIEHGLGDATGGNGVSGQPETARIRGFAPTTRAVIQRLQEVQYYIGNNPAGRASLYRWTPGGGAEEVVENVEDMDLMFGVDTNGDGAADNYLAASAIAATAWPSVVTVRVALLISSPDVAPTNQQQTVTFRDNNADGMPDAELAPNDGRLRQVFSATIALRNRLL